jgi:hypothetical protein
MRRLRSRWTVVALVPACFLASFGLVTALAGGDEAPVPAAAGIGTGGDASAAPATTEVASTAGATTTGPGAPTTGTTGEGGTITQDGNGDGHAGPAPPPGAIAVDYGRWEGVFEITDTEIVPEFGMATVTGQFRYLGGTECSQVGAVELRGRFYSPSGQAIGTGRWESIRVTGEGAEVPQREPLFLEFTGAVTEEATSARIRLTRVDCL